MSTGARGVHAGTSECDRPEVRRRTRRRFRPCIRTGSARAGCTRAIPGLGPDASSSLACLRGFEGWRKANPLIPQGETLLGNDMDSPSFDV